MPLIPHFQPLPTPQAIIKELPASQENLAFVEKSRRDIAKTLSQENDRFLLIIGPCSIHDSTGTLEYASKLLGLAKSLGHAFLVVMRFFFEKPRSALGWKGYLYDPELDGSFNATLGIRKTRELLLKLTNLGIAVGSEFLDPLALPFFSDLISWGCIGARTAESQTHRHLASLLPMPVGFKNSTSGNIEAAVLGAFVARHSHTFFGIHPLGFPSLITSPGNPHTHIILRGGVSGPNYQESEVKKASLLMKKKELQDTVLIDCSHGNSEKNPKKQKEVFFSVFQRWLLKDASIKGALVESYLKGGKQTLLEPKKASKDLSITDPCLGWEETEELLTACFEMYQKQQKSCDL